MSRSQIEENHRGVLGEASGCHKNEGWEFYLKASPLPPAPLVVAGFMVAGLAAWQYSDRLAGLLGFAVWLLFC